MGPRKKTVEEMEAHLKRWSARIDEAAARTESAGARATLGEHQRIDELTGCREVARARLAQYRASGEEERETLERGLALAWSALAAAMRKPRGGKRLSTSIGPGRPPAVIATKDSRPDQHASIHRSRPDRAKPRRRKERRSQQ